MSELLSYANILKDIQNFKRSGTNHGQEFNIYDTPSHKYFKILFYFGSDPEFGADGGSGLLAPTWEIFKPITIADLLGVKWKELSASEIADGMKRVAAHNANHNYYDYNSAWAYLKINDEEERAEKLEQFVTLLSDINTNSPWYFSTISGIGDAINRKSVEDGKIDVSEDRKITINCLPDAFDNRIGTLLELYRDITWSWVQKKEIIPANLRKFDMAVYIFETPEINWHKVKDRLINPKDTIIGTQNRQSAIQQLLINSNDFKPSYKMIEFHDCEFNYNAAKTAWGDIDNKVGIAPTYSIEISYKDCYEISYNDIMMRTIGDVILTDMPRTAADYESKPQSDDLVQQALLKSKRNPYDHGIIGNALEQVVGTATADVKNLAKKAILGNIYGYSLTGVVDYAKDILNGNLIQVLQKSGVDTNKPATKGGQSVKEWVKKNLYGQKPKTTNTSLSGNIFNPSTIANN